MKRMELIVPCHFGMEAVLKRDIQDLGYDVTAVEDGRVTFIADADGITRANVFLRTAERVLLKVGKFKAEYEITTNTTSLYYATINIVDYLALYEDVIPKMKKSKLYRILFELQSITGDTVEDIADANDAGDCKTWNELVNRFKELHKKGERY